MDCRRVNRFRRVRWGDYKFTVLERLICRVGEYFLSPPETQGSATPTARAQVGSQKDFTVFWQEFGRFGWILILGGGEWG